MITRALQAFIVALSIGVGVVAAGQIPEYDFYADFRGWVQTIPASQRTPATIVERYSQRLRTQGVSDAEITRCIDLVRSNRDALENDFWNRFFTSGTSNYNTAPNAFLVSIVEKRKPGKALEARRFAHEGTGRSRSTTDAGKETSWAARLMCCCESRQDVSRAAEHWTFDTASTEGSSCERT